MERLITKLVTYSLQKGESLKDRIQKLWQLIEQLRHSPNSEAQIQLSNELDQLLLQEEIY